MAIRALASSSFRIIQTPRVTALPGVIFSVWHKLTGFLILAIWSRRDPRPLSTVASVLVPGHNGEHALRTRLPHPLGS